MKREIAIQSTGGKCIPNLKTHRYKLKAYLPQVLNCTLISNQILQPELLDGHQAAHI